MLYIALSFIISTCLGVKINKVAPQTELGDEITNLPGQPPVSFDQYSGYITLPSNSNKHIFYWLQMSTAGDDAPVMMWTNGGPGCSGLLGCLTEQGAFRIQSDGTLMVNPGGWNNLAHMIFIEQPVGVGFSYSDDTSDYNTGDHQAVEDMFYFIMGFLKEFPNLATNDFYITSESYGGHYMPQLGNYIVNNNDGTINFKGIMVGNPYTDPVENAIGMYNTFYGHSMIPLPLFQQYQQACDNGNNYNEATCQTYMNEIEKTVGDVYFYGVDWSVCNGNNQKLTERMWFIDHVLKPMGRGYGFEQSKKSINNNPLNDNRRKLQGTMWDACATDYETTYLDRTDVQTALHVNTIGTKWHECGGVKWNTSDEYTPMEPYWQSLMDLKDLHIMIYSGDDDTVCGTMGTQSWIYNLGYDITETWQPWYQQTSDDGRQTAGYYEKFGDYFTFVTVHSAGHEVPWYKSTRSLEMVQNFLDGKF